MKKVGERLTELLIEYGVDVVFGVPGGQTLPLYEGIQKANGKIRHALVRDERTAVFAADAYARQTGKTGVCDATVGPGATNLPSGLAEAYASSIPLVAIIADIPRGWEHRKDRGSAAQGMHQLEMFSKITKWVGVVNVPEAIDSVVDTCFRIAQTGRPGPTVICIPDDVFSASLPDDAVQAVATRRQHHPWYRSAAYRPDILRAAQLLAESKKPALFVGGGSHLSQAYDQIQKLAERLQSPVATTITGKGAIGELHPLLIGVAGSMGRTEANDMLKEADALFIIGNKMGQVASLQWELPAKHSKVIQLDIDPAEIEKNVPVDIALVGDAGATLDALLEELDKLTQTRTEWQDARLKAWTAWKKAVPEHLDANPAHQMDVMRALNSYIRPDDIVVCDASLSSSWAAAHVVIRQAGRHYIAPRGLAGLGYGAPAAIGASMGNLKENQKVICLSGDGAWGYSMGEVETMHRFQLPILMIVINNRVLGWVKHVEKTRFRERYISTDFAEVDYAKAAEALGAQAFRVSNVEEFAKCLDQVWDIQTPVFIEVSVTQWDSPVLRNNSSGGEF